MRITFLVPHLVRISGGVKIICGYARRLSQRGHQITLICKERKIPFIRNIIHNFVNTAPWINLKGTRVKFTKEFKTDKIPPADVIFATSYKTAIALQEIPDTKGRKFYLVQALEHMLNPADAKKAEETYYMPFTKIVVSNYLKEELKRMFNQSAEHIPNAIDQKEFFPEQRPCPPEGQDETRRIGMLYHTAEYKGFSDALRAIETVRKKIPLLRLVIVGTRHRTPRLPPTLSTKEQDCRYFHKPPVDKLRAIYNSCDIFISASWYEGFGLPGLEAMACKKALVTTDNGGCRDYAIHNETSLVSPPREPEKLAENVIKLLSDRSLLTRISDKGYEMSHKFNWATSIAMMEALLKRG
ncbi:MAG: glycosyltransferase family 4 protein [Planctomycetota bacterium]|nr:glycosyltransferase family 4 protein [Planctomycetota bacterium]MDI6787118.1 glycosyltransferase family 4 protein [Planctomycetota bacterium]